MLHPAASSCGDSTCPAAESPASMRPADLLESLHLAHFAAAAGALRAAVERPASMLDTQAYLAQVYLAQANLVQSNLRGPSQGLSFASSAGAAMSGPGTLDTGSAEADRPTQYSLSTVAAASPRVRGLGAHRLWALQSSEGGGSQAVHLRLDV